MKHGFKEYQNILKENLYLFQAEDIDELFDYLGSTMKERLYLKIIKSYVSGKKPKDIALEYDLEEKIVKKIINLGYRELKRVFYDCKKYIEMELSRNPRFEINSVLDSYRNLKNGKEKTLLCLETPIKELNFSKNTYKILHKSHKIKTLGDLLSLEEEELIQLRNLTQKELDELEEKIVLSADLMYDLQEEYDKNEIDFE